MVRRYDPPVLDTLLDALGTARRRYVLYYVREHGETDIADVTATVTDWLATWSDESGGNAPMIASVRSTLHHSDLPKLSAAGLVSVDDGSNTVRYEGAGVEEAILDVLEEHERVAEQPTVIGDSLYRGV